MSDIVRASQFVVVDSNGRERARLGMLGDRVGLELTAPDASRPAVELSVREASGAVRLALSRGGQNIELELSDKLASVKLSCGDRKCASALSIDDAGAWVVAEATKDLGVRMLCRNDGRATSIWLSEQSERAGERCVHTRYLRSDPIDDKASQWQREP